RIDREESLADPPERAGFIPDHELIGVLQDDGVAVLRQHFLHFGSDVRGVLTAGRKHDLDDLGGAALVQFFERNLGHGGLLGLLIARNEMERPLAADKDETLVRRLGRERLVEQVHDLGDRELGILGRLDVDGARRSDNAGERQTAVVGEPFDHVAPRLAVHRERDAFLGRFSLVWLVRLRGMAGLWPAYRHCQNDHRKKAPPGIRSDCSHDYTPPCINRKEFVCSLASWLWKTAWPHSTPQKSEETRKCR